MNKRIRNKIEKQQALAQQEAHQNAPLVQRVRDDLAHGVAEVKQDVAETVQAVVAEVKAEIKTIAPELQQNAQELVKRVPVIGDAAAEKIGELGKRVEQLTA